MNDNNIDAPLAFPSYQAPPQGIVHSDPRLQKTLIRFMKQKMPKRMNHKMTRKSFKKKIV